MDLANSNFSSRSPESTSIEFRRSSKILPSLSVDESSNPIVTEPVKQKIFKKNSSQTNVSKLYDIHGRLIISPDDHFPATNFRLLQTDPLPADPQKRVVYRTVALRNGTKFVHTEILPPTKTEILRETFRDASQSGMGVPPVLTHSNSMASKHNSPNTFNRNHSLPSLHANSLISHRNSNSFQNKMNFLTTNSTANMPTGAGAKFEPPDLNFSDMVDDRGLAIHPSNRGIFISEVSLAQRVSTRKISPEVKSRLYNSNSGGKAVQKPLHKGDSPSSPLSMQGIRDEQSKFPRVPSLQLNDAVVSINKDISSSLSTHRQTQRTGDSQPLQQSTLNKSPRAIDPNYSNLNSLSSRHLKISPPYASSLHKGSIVVLDDKAFVERAQKGLYVYNAGEDLESALLSLPPLPDLTTLQEKIDEFPGLFSLRGSVDLHLTSPVTNAKRGDTEAKDKKSKNKNKHSSTNGLKTEVSDNGVTGFDELMTSVRMKKCATGILSTHRGNPHELDQKLLLSSKKKSDNRRENVGFSGLDGSEGDSSRHGVLLDNVTRAINTNNMNNDTNNVENSSAENQFIFVGNDGTKKTVSSSSKGKNKYLGSSSVQSKVPNNNSNSDSVPVFHSLLSLRSASNSLGDGSSVELVIALLQRLRLHENPFSNNDSNNNNMNSNAKLNNNQNNRNALNHGNKQMEVVLSSNNIYGFEFGMDYSPFAVDRRSGRNVMVVSPEFEMKRNNNKNKFISSQNNGASTSNLSTRNKNNNGSNFSITLLGDPFKGSGFFLVPGISLDVFIPYPLHCPKYRALASEGLSTINFRSSSVLNNALDDGATSFASGEDELHLTLAGAGASPAAKEAAINMIENNPLGPWTTSKPKANINNGLNNTRGKKVEDSNSPNGGLSPQIGSSKGAHILEHKKGRRGSAFVPRTQDSTTAFEQAKEETRQVMKDRRIQRRISNADDETSQHLEYLDQNSQTLSNADESDGDSAFAQENSNSRLPFWPSDAPEPNPASRIPIGLQIASSANDPLGQLILGQGGVLAVTRHDGQVHISRVRRGSTLEVNALLNAEKTDFSNIEKQTQPAQDLDSIHNRSPEAKILDDPEVLQDKEYAILTSVAAKHLPTPVGPLVRLTTLAQRGLIRMEPEERVQLALFIHWFAEAFGQRIPNLITRGLALALFRALRIVTARPWASTTAVISPQVGAAANPSMLSARPAMPRSVAFGTTFEDGSPPQKDSSTVEGLGIPMKGISALVDALLGPYIPGLAGVMKSSTAGVDASSSIPVLTVTQMCFAIDRSLVWRYACCGAVVSNGNGLKKKKSRDPIRNDRRGSGGSDKAFAGLTLGVMSVGGTLAATFFSKFFRERWMDLKLGCLLWRLRLEQKRHALELKESYVMSLKRAVDDLESELRSLVMEKRFQLMKIAMNSSSGLGSNGLGNSNRAIAMKNLLSISSDLIANNPQAFLNINLNTSREEKSPTSRSGRALLAGLKTSPEVSSNPLQSNGNQSTVLESSKAFRTWNSLTSFEQSSRKRDVSAHMVDLKFKAALERQQQDSALQSIIGSLPLQINQSALGRMTLGVSELFDKASRANHINKNNKVNGSAEGQLNNNYGSDYLSELEATNEQDLLMNPSKPIRKLLKTRVNVVKILLRTCNYLWCKSLSRRPTFLTALVPDSYFIVGNISDTKECERLQERRIILMETMKKVKAMKFASGTSPAITFSPSKEALNNTSNSKISVSGVQSASSPSSLPNSTTPRGSNNKNDKGHSPLKEPKLQVPTLALNETTILNSALRINTDSNLNEASNSFDPTNKKSQIINSLMQRNQLQQSSSNSLHASSSTPALPSPNNGSNPNLNSSAVLNLIRESNTVTTNTQRQIDLTQFYPGTEQFEDRIKVMKQKMEMCLNAGGGHVLLQVRGVTDGEFEEISRLYERQKLISNLYHLPIASPSAEVLRQRQLSLMIGEPEVIQLACQFEPLFIRLFLAFSVHLKAPKNAGALTKKPAYWPLIVNTLVRSNCVNGEDGANIRRGDSRSSVASDYNNASNGLNNVTGSLLAGGLTSGTANFGSLLMNTMNNINNNSTSNTFNNSGNVDNLNNIGQMLQNKLYPNMASPRTNQHISGAVNSKNNVSSALSLWDFNCIFSQDNPKRQNNTNNANKFPALSPHGPTGPGCGVDWGLSPESLDWQLHLPWRAVASLATLLGIVPKMCTMSDLKVFYNAAVCRDVWVWKMADEQQQHPSNTSPSTMNNNTTTTKKSTYNIQNATSHGKENKTKSNTNGQPSPLNSPNHPPQNQNRQISTTSINQFASDTVVGVFNNNSPLRKIASLPLSTLNQKKKKPIDNRDAHDYALGDSLSEDDDDEDDEKPLDILFGANAGLARWCPDLKAFGQTEPSHSTVFQTLSPRNRVNSNDNDSNSHINGGGTENAAILSPSSPPPNQIRSNSNYNGVNTNLSALNTSIMDEPAATAPVSSNIANERLKKDFRFGIFSNSEPCDSCGKSDYCVCVLSSVKQPKNFSLNRTNNLNGVSPICNIAFHNHANSVSSNVLGHSSSQNVTSNTRSISSPNQKNNSKKATAGNYLSAGEIPNAKRNNGGGFNNTNKSNLTSNHYNSSKDAQISPENQNNANVNIGANKIPCPESKFILVRAFGFGAFIELLLRIGLTKIDSGYVGGGGGAAMTSLGKAHMVFAAICKLLYDNLSLIEDAGEALRSIEKQRFAISSFGHSALNNTGSDPNLLVPDHQYGNLTGSTAGLTQLREVTKSIGRAAPFPTPTSQMKNTINAVTSSFGKFDMVGGGGGGGGIAKDVKLGEIDSHNPSIDVNIFNEFVGMVRNSISDPLECMKTSVQDALMLLLADSNPQLLSKTFESFPHQNENHNASLSAGQHNNNTKNINGDYNNFGDNGFSSPHKKLVRPFAAQEATLQKVATHLRLRPHGTGSVGPPPAHLFLNKNTSNAGNNKNGVPESAFSAAAVVQKISSHTKGDDIHNRKHQSANHPPIKTSVEDQIAVELADILKGRIKSSNHDTVPGVFNHSDGICGELSLVPPIITSTLASDDFSGMADSVMGPRYNDGYGELPNILDLVDVRLLELHRTIGGSSGLMDWIRNPPSIPLSRVGIDWASDGISWEFATRTHREKLRRLRSLKEMNGRILLEFDAPQAILMMKGDDLNDGNDSWSANNMSDLQVWLSKVLSDPSSGLLMDLAEPNWNVLTLEGVLDVWKVAVMDDADRRQRECDGALEDCEITYM